MLRRGDSGVTGMGWRVLRNALVDCNLSDEDRLGSALLPAHRVIQRSVLLKPAPGAFGPGPLATLWPLALNMAACCNPGPTDQQLPKTSVNTSTQSLDESGAKASKDDPPSRVRKVRRGWRDDQAEVEETVRVLVQNPGVQPQSWDHQGVICGLKAKYPMPMMATTA